MSKLLEQLRCLPQFNSFEAGVLKSLTIENPYVRNFAPEQDGFYDEKGDDGKQHCMPFHLSDSQVMDEAIDGLLNDNSGYFEEFVYESQLRYDVVELVRVLIKEILDK